MSMWQQIRENSKISLKDFANMVGYLKQNISSFEKGKRPMPIKLQIEFKTYVDQIDKLRFKLWIFDVLV